MIEICAICGAYVKNVNRHVYRNHREDLFECSECKRTFKRKDTLKIHIQGRHANPNNNQKTCTKKNLHAVKRRNRVNGVKDCNILHVPVFECEMCNKKFTRKDSLKKHCRNVHHVGAEVQLYECDYCSKVFHYKYSLKSHILLCQSKSKVQSDDIKKTKLYTCLVSSCQVTCNGRYSIIKHYQRDHNIQLIWECLEFGTRKEFDEWLISLQKNSTSLCQFCTIVKWENSTSYNQKFVCHRSGIPPVQKQRVRFEKLTGSKKLGGFCPAEITVKESKMDKICKVKMQKTHVGHSPDCEEELAFISLNKNLKEEIVNKLAVEVPQDTISMQHQSSVSSSTHFERPDLINYDDVASIAVSAGLNIYRALSKDDAQNVQSFIYDHQKSIHFFKAEGAEDTEYGVLSTNDFAVVYMDEFQKDMLCKFGCNVIAYDSTNKTDPNDFLLHTILVIDEEWEGVAVAFLLSNRNDVTILEIFLSVIKKQVGLLKPHTFMTDMQMSFFNAFMVIMTQPKFALWCIWHVCEAWRKNQKKITDSKKRRQVLQRCYKLSQYTDQNLFNVKLVEFLNDDDEDLKPFIEYFRDIYVPHVEKWAYCYRVESKMSTNMSIESFHSFFKTKIGRKKKIKTVHQCLCSIVTYSNIKKKNRKMKSIHPQITEKLKVLRNRHHKAVNHKANGNYTVHTFHQDEESVCTHTWLISSFHNKEISCAEKKNADGKNGETEEMEDSHDDRCMQPSDKKKKKKNINKLYDHHEVESDEINMYVVQRDLNVDLHTSSSSLKCTLCGIAFSEYSCTCIDYLVKNNMCEHIHAVVMHCRDTNTQCKCSPQIVETVQYTSEQSYQSIEDEETQKLKRSIWGRLENMNIEELQNIEKLISST